MAKGEYEGECNRRVCTNKATWWNRITEAHYCRTCAVAINSWRPEGVDPLCVPVMTIPQADRDAEVTETSYYLTPTIRPEYEGLTLDRVVIECGEEDDKPEDGYTLFSRKILNTMDAELKRMSEGAEKEEDNGDL